jgi:hypothetical protein
MRLADDDPPELAAAIADTSPDVLERLMAGDAAFKALVLACRALRDLPDEVWLGRMRRLVRERQVLADVEDAEHARPAARPNVGRPHLVVVASNPEPSGTARPAPEKDEA